MGYTSNKGTSGKFFISNSCFKLSSSRKQKFLSEKVSFKRLIEFWRCTLLFLNIRRYQAIKEYSMQNNERNYLWRIKKKRRLVIFIKNKKLSTNNPIYCPSICTFLKKNKYQFLRYDIPYFKTWIITLQYNKIYIKSSENSNVSS